MKKIQAALQISLLTLGLFFLFPVHASAEIIKSFNSQITVNVDNSVSVVETIMYDSQGLEKHGIFRDILPRSSEGKKMSITNISVTDQSGQAIPWQKLLSGPYVQLKIGDPNSTFYGERNYVIRYDATNAVAHLQEYDEIYWNATGNSWLFPVSQSSATVILPPGAQVLQSACYVGRSGSTTSCVAQQNGSEFVSSRDLGTGEGLTVAVGFPKGIVAPPTPESFIKKYGVILGAIMIPLIVGIICFVRWRKYGQDPKNSKTIIAQYDIPDGLTPLEIGMIFREKSRNRDISTELIYLATKGYIKIQQIDSTILGLIHNKDYKLTLLKDMDGLPDFDTKILRGIFTGVGHTIKLSSLRNIFYKSIPPTFKLVRETMLAKQYYKYLPKTGTSPLGFIPLAQIFFFLLLTASASGIIGNQSLSLHNILIVGGSVICTGMIYALFQYLMPAKTEKGVATKNHILGLKHYLEVAEKDRLNFHNAPEKKPEIFEQLLPYAMVLGVDHAWAKEFEGIYTAPPSWYEGDSNHGFNTLLFTDSLTDFAANASSSLAASPSGNGGLGGSGGGGSSGGGGGGGGGGSW